MIGPDTENEEGSISANRLRDGPWNMNAWLMEDLPPKKAQWRSCQAIRLNAVSKVLASTLSLLELSRYTFATWELFCGSARVDQLGTLQYQFLRVEGLNATKFCHSVGSE